MSQRSRVLPGFGLSLGFTLAYLSLIVLIPLSAVFIKSLGIGWDGLWEILSSERILKSLQLSFSAALIAALINVVFGLLLAWCLVRYTFPGKRIVDALVDLPFALPTAVAGYAVLLTCVMPAGRSFVGASEPPHAVSTAPAKAVSAQWAMRCFCRFALIMLSPHFSTDTKERAQRAARRDRRRPTTPVGK